MATPPGSTIQTVPYKVFPIVQPSPALPGVTESWMPMLNVSLIINHRLTKSIEAIVDSGSFNCLFHADIAIAYGLKVDSVNPEPLGGVLAGKKGYVFYHKVSLVVPGGGQPIKLNVGFSPNLSVAGLLGRYGFFEHFVVTFDPSAKPPSLSYQRFYRS